MGAGREEALSSIAPTGKMEEESVSSIAVPGKEEETLSSMAHDVEATLEESDSDGDSETADWNLGLAVTLGNGGLVMVLFETPSGFAIFSYDGVKLILPDAVKNVWSDFFTDFVARKVAWLKDFQTFEDKSNVITGAGINEKLAKMIQKNVITGQKLVVAKREYVDVIQKCLNIDCMWNEAVEELMWGLSYQMRYFLPEEDSKLTNKGFHLLCQGMRDVLETHSLHVKPQMVSERIVEAACVVHECNRCVNKHHDSLHSAGGHLKKISNIDYESWDLLKIATALKLICYPDETIEIGNPLKLFSEVEWASLQKDAPKYEGLIYKVICLTVYKEILRARKFRFRALKVLFALVKQANDEYDEAQAMAR